LESMGLCPFCDIAINTQKITENKTCILTVCLAPYHQHHLLVIPKRHVEKIIDLTKEESDDSAELQKVAISLMNKLGHDNLSLFTKEGLSSAKTVNHVHFHVVPEIHLTNTENTMIENREVITPYQMSHSVAKFKNILVN